MTVAKGVMIFATSPADEEAIVEAKKYIKANSFTGEDVKILSGNNITYVETKREVELKI